MKQGDYMANVKLPWQRYLSDIAHKYVGYPDEGEDNMFIVEITAGDSDNFVSNKTGEEIYNAAQNGEIPIAILKTDDEVFVYTFEHGEYIDDPEDYQVSFIGIVLVSDTSSASFEEFKISNTSCELTTLVISETQE